MSTEIGPGSPSGDAFKRLSELQARRDAKSPPAAAPEPGHEGDPLPAAVPGIELRTLRRDRDLVRGLSGQELATAFQAADAANPDGRLDAAEFEDLIGFVADAKAAKAAQKSPEARAKAAEERFLAELPELVAELGRPGGPVVPEGGFLTPLAGANQGSSPRITQLRRYLRDARPETEARNLQLIGAVAEAAAANAGRNVQVRAMRILASQASAVPRTAVVEAAADALRDALAGPLTRPVRAEVARALLRGDRDALREQAPALLVGLGPKLAERIEQALAAPEDLRPRPRFRRRLVES